MLVIAMSLAMLMVKMLVMIIMMFFGLVRPRRSIRVHALAPTLSQRDVLQANVVANGRRGPLYCGSLALPLAALLSTTKGGF